VYGGSAFVKMCQALQKICIRVDNLLLSLHQNCYELS